MAVMIDRLRRHPQFLAFLALLGAGLLVFARSLGNDFVIWDDDTLVYKNPLVLHLNWSTLRGIFTTYDPELYVPLTLFTYQLEYLFFGPNPFIYHLDNLLLHVVNAFLVLQLLRRLGLRDGIAFGCALLFLVHPLNVEAVAWISARKDLLAVLFTLLTLVTYLRHRESGAPRLFRLAVLFCLLALLSKAIAVVVPLLLLLIDVLQGRRLDRRMILEKAPFFLLAILFFVIGIFGKTQNISDVTPLQTILLAAKAAAFYLKMFILPSGISIIYLQITPIVPSREFLVPMALLAIVAAMTLWSLRRTRVLLFGMAFFFVCLAPSFANFSKAGDIYFASDRYPYLANVGLLFLLGAGCSMLIARPAARAARRFWPAVAAIILLAFSGQSFARTFTWRDSESLFRDALLKNDKSSVLHLNLGLLAHLREDYDEAEGEYRRALELDPRYADAFTNLGALLHRRGEDTAAEQAFQQALAINPAHPQALNNYGSLLLDQGQAERAVELLEYATRINPWYAQAHVNLGAAYGRVGRYEEGLRAFKAAFRLQGGEGIPPDIVRALEQMN